MSEIINSKDWAKTYKACNFIEKGVCEYSDERVYLSQETLMRCSQSLKGRPVVIDHVRGITPDNMQKYAVGYVTKVGSDCDSFSCDFVVFDDDGNQVILDGYSVSCAYKPLAFAAGGTWHNVPYDREITDLEFTHLALVKNPRYEDAKVYMNSKEDGRWITVKGTHVFIKDGQSVEDAMKEHGFGKSFSTGEKKESYYRQKEDKDLLDEHDKIQKQKEELLKKLKATDDIAEGDKILAQMNGLNKQQEALGNKRIEIAKEGYLKGKELKGKYAKEDADFDVQQMKKDIETAQELGYKEVEDIAEFLGLDDDEVRETLAKSSNEKSEYKKALEKVEYDKVKEQKKKFDKLPPAESKGQEKARKVVRRELDKKLSKEKADSSIRSSYSAKELSQMSIGTKLYVEAKSGGYVEYTKTDMTNWSSTRHKDDGSTREGTGVGSDSLSKKNFIAKPQNTAKIVRSAGVDIDIDTMSNMPARTKLVRKSKDDSYLVYHKNDNAWSSYWTTSKVTKDGRIVELSGKDIDSMPKKGFVEAPDIVRKAIKGNYYDIKEKRNSKEEDMNFDEFFNKMGEMLEEKLNSCKSKMNADEEQDDDDKFEMDGEIYSKKELVNAFKEKKNAEEEAAKKEEEEKQNGLDAFNQMEEKMNSRPEGDDKIEVYSQKAGLERGKAIYGK